MDNIIPEAELELLRQELASFENIYENISTIQKNFKEIRAQKNALIQQLLEVAKKPSGIEKFKAEAPQTIPALLRLCEVEKRYTRVIELRVSAYEEKMLNLIKKNFFSFASPDLGLRLQESFKILFNITNKSFDLIEEENNLHRDFAENLQKKWTIWARVISSSNESELLRMCAELTAKYEKMKNVKHTLFDSLRERSANIINLCENITFVGPYVSSARKEGAAVMAGFYQERIEALKKSRRRVIRSADSDDDFVDEIIAVGLCWI